MLCAECQLPHAAECNSQVLLLDHLLDQVQLQICDNLKYLAQKKTQIQSDQNLLIVSQRAYKQAATQHKAQISSAVQNLIDLLKYKET